MMTDAEADGIYAALVTADDAGDAGALAEIAWQLYGELGLVRDRARGYEALLARLAEAARAAVTARSTSQPGPLYPLQHLLSRGLWLPEPDGGIRHPAQRTPAAP